jgi:DNA-binding LacI/PurR family transcriptional regulator
LLQELAGRGIPVVSIGSTKKLESATSIEVDYRKGIRQAIQHLAVLGHRRISFISGPLHLRAAKLRQDAYIASMAEIGIKVPASYMIEGDHKMEGGYAAAEECFKRGQLPTALLCSNDMTAIGVLHALSARGLKVPEDISIVGFDDIHMAQFTVPPLTSIRMAGSDLAKAAFHALPLYLDSQSKKHGEDQLTVPTSLVVRQTTGYAPHAVTSEEPIKRHGKNPQRRKASIRTGTNTKE